jgi:Fur family peroxide stress response transcriptional regulator
MNKRNSRQKTAILACVQSAENHPTADWIFNQVREDIPNISLGTVYRNLNQLVSDGLIGAYQYGKTVCYDGVTERHDHFRCLQCNTIIDIDVLGSDIVSQINHEQDFHVSKASLELVGTCKSCLNQ